MDRFEKSTPVTRAPSRARRVAYSPGPQPKSAILVPGSMWKRSAIHATDSSMKAIFREARSVFWSRWNRSICFEIWSSFQSVSAV